MHLERAEGGDQHGAIRRKASLAAFDVDKLLASEIRPESRFGDDVVAKFQRGGGREHRVTAMGDVGERPAVDEGRRAFQGLHQVGCERLPEQHRHRSMRLELAGTHWFAIARVPDDDLGEPLFEVLHVPGETEDRHDLGGDRDVKAVLAREAVGDPAERIDDRAQCPIIHVHDAAPSDAAAVDPERITPIDVIVDQGGEQIVRRGDGMDVAGKVQVDVFHRHHLRVTAAGGAALHAEARAQARLADAQDRFFADEVERIGEADRGGCLAFAGGGGRDRGNQDQFAVGTALQ